MEQQLLTEQEIHELGLQALVPWLESHNFKIDYMQTDMNTVPQNPDGYRRSNGNVPAQGCCR